ncbi:MAG: DUF4179 domain-containing protein [Butyricicoccus sp.]|nr:DUF4179 domain-containing protein [Butyricicoccus sp.]
MNRIDELREMQMLCAETPQELEFTVQRAVSRAAAKERRTKRVRRVLTPLASLTGVAAAFVIMVNASVPFAMACSKVPGLNELTQMVARDPSLRMALAHDYVQLVKQTASDGDLTVSIECLIADRSNLTLFYRADDANGEPLTGTPELIDENGARIEGYSASWGYPGEDELQHAEFLFNETEVPEVFGVAFTSRGEEQPGLEYEITFDRIRIGPGYRDNGRIVTVDETLTILGQKVIIEQVELYPLQTRIVYRFDEENTAKFTRLPFYLLDSAGNRIDKEAGGITGFGAPDEENRCTAILDTVWWDEDETYTLCVDEAAIVYYADEEVRYDPVTETFTGLPDYVSRYEDDFRDLNYDMQLAIDCPKGQMSGSIFAWDVRDAATGEEIERPDGYSAGTLSWRPYEKNPDRDRAELPDGTPGYFVNCYDFSGYDRPVILKLNWAPAQQLDPPIRLELK